MILFIQIRDGAPYEHPIFADNLVQAFPHLDLNNLPPEFARFIRRERPSIGVYEVFDTPELTYEWEDGIVVDSWHNRPMTAEERQAKIDEVKSSFTPTEDGWVFDEETCAWVSPQAASLDASGGVPNVIG